MINTLNDDLLKALIVDDEQDVCFILSRLLKNKKLETACVHSLAAAEAHLQDDEPGIIFLDNHLPDGLGINYINKLKQQYPNTKVVMFTAHDSADDREKAMRNGADLFIGKPFTGETIAKAVDSLT